MMIYEVSILVHDDTIGHFEVIGYVRRDYYSTYAALEMARSIPELRAMMEGHGVDVRCITWDRTHRDGDSITSWTGRTHRW